LASLPSWLESKGSVGISSVEENLCEEEFDSDKCFRPAPEERWHV
jgi:hypothetical protein